MRVLIVGSGGREHALAWRLAREAEVFAAPGNPGIAQCAECFEVKADDTGGLVELCGRLRPDLAVVGPEAPLIAGLADRLRAAGHAVFGPGADGARLEGSKAFAKEFMREAGVPTAAFATFREAAKAEEFARQAYGEGGQLAVKASGPALGKGVAVAESLEEALAAIRRMMVDREFGDAGSEVVLEERLRGREFSLIALCSGESYASLPTAQDYKRAHDGDSGPNTGGMGSNSPVAWLSAELVADAEDQVLAPILKLLKARAIDFRGALYAGLIVSEGETAKCLEFNVRFGDPETQCILPRVGPGFAEALVAAANGERLPSLRTLANAAVTVVVAAAEYPETPRTGLPLTLATPEEDGVLLFHAATRHGPNGLETSGGRAANVTGVANGLAEARERAYRNVGLVRFEGARWRSDIACEPAPVPGSRIGRG